MIVADMIDAQSFERMSMRYQVMSVPLTVVNGVESVVGAVPEGQLMSRIRAAVGA